MSHFLASFPAGDLVDHCDTAPQHITRDQFVSELVVCDRRIRGLLATLLADWNDIDEVLQEISLLAWKKHKEFTYVGDELTPQFRAWLVAIAKNKARQLLHGKKKIAFEPVVIETLLHAQDIDSLSNDPRREALPSCLDKLTPRNRSLLSQRYGKGIPVERIAACERRSASSIYKMLANIRQQLLKCISVAVAKEET